MTHPGEPKSILRLHVPGDLGGPVLYVSDNYDSYPSSFAHNDLQPHPRIRELAEQVHNLWFHYKENETESKSPSIFFFFFCRRQKNMHRN